MATKLFIGNLSFQTNEQTLTDLFAAYSELVSVSVIKDRDTQKSRGFGFIEMADDNAAKKAVTELNNKEVDNRNINVSVAKERESKPNRQAGYQKSW